MTRPMTPQTPLPGLVIFDCDGVLVDSEPITNRMMAKDITAAGVPMTTAQAIELFVGGTIASAFEKARGMGARLPDDWVAGFYDRMIATLNDEVEAVPGIHTVLEQLDNAQIPWVIASNGPMRKMQATLGRTGLWDLAGGAEGGRIFSAHDVGVAKPDPGLFLYAAKSHDTAPEHCIVIEDSASGARAAQAAGMTCYGFTADTPAEKLTAHGAIPFDDMAKLSPLIFGRNG